MAKAHIVPFDPDTDSDTDPDPDWSRRLGVRQQELVVVDEELALIVVGQLLEVLAEFAERILAALEVRVVGAEAVDFLESVPFDHQR
jgi:hypothetical protein